MPIADASTDHSGGEQGEVLTEVSTGGLVQPAVLDTDKGPLDLLIVRRVGRGAPVVDQNLEPEGAGSDEEKLPVAAVPPIGALVATVIVKVPSPLSVTCWSRSVKLYTSVYVFRVSRLVTWWCPSRWRRSTPARRGPGS